jgi:hypothetical protein
LNQQWVIPPKADAAFVCALEEVLDVYERPDDPQRPVVCVDEGGKQLVGETRVPIPAQPRRAEASNAPNAPSELSEPSVPSVPGHPERYDYEYTREGGANLFLAFEPLAGVRTVQVTEHQTAVDFAHFIHYLLEKVYPNVEKVVLVMDNLNTHEPASLYKAFPAEEAHRLLQRLEIHHTPKHGSWLNMAEIELSALTRQCLDRRIGSLEELDRAVAAWTQNRNARKVTANWQFTTKDTRIKLKHLYPTIQE